ncbi:hypothetical protein BH23CHL2_BH23CHL2_32320 [soil metagenome]
MRTEIMYQPSYAVTRVTLDPHEQIRVESGTMISMDPYITLETSASGGLFSSIKRAAFGGESFFMTTYTGDETGGEVLVVPALPGNLTVLEVPGEELVVDLIGPGDVYLQTRSQDAFLSWLIPSVP